MPDETPKTAPETVGEENPLPPTFLPQNSAVQRNVPQPESVIKRGGNTASIAPAAQKQPAGGAHVDFK